MPPSNLRRRAWLLLAASISIHIILLTTTHRIGKRTLPRNAALLKRFSEESRPSDDDSILDFPYLDWYNALPLTYRPIFVLFLLFVLAFLFSFIGISASDFFCPNLSTVAAYLGLSESTAGVTFLAFGNGSPDVFSTFSAMSSGTLGLAVGELIGAATFIVSIVVGSIALIRPFHIPKLAFRRDVIFFTIAVLVLIVSLHDGHLTFFESGSMVGLYVVYVGVVVSESWWMRRIRRQQGLKDKLSSNSISQIVKPMVVNGRLSPQPPSPVEFSPRSSSPMEHASPISIQVTDREQAFLTPGSETSARRRRSSYANLVSHHYHDESIGLPTPRVNMSLLGAIEFRDVVNSLRREGSTQCSTRSNSPGGTPTPGGGRERLDYFGPVGHGHRRSISQGHAFQPHLMGLDRRRSSLWGRRRSSTYSADFIDRDRRRIISAPSPIPSARSSEEDQQTKTPTPVGLGINSSELNPWSDQTGNPPTPLPGFTTSEQISPSNSKPSLPKLLIPDNSFSRTHTRQKPPVPSISIVDPSGHTSSSPLLPTPPLLSTTPSSTISRRQKIHKNIKIALRILFPSLQSFRHKSLLGMILSSMSVPAILALTLTLPVVDDGHEMEQGGVKLEDGDEYGFGDVGGNYLGDGYDRDGNVDGDDETYGDGDGEGEQYDYDQGQEEADQLIDPQIGEELHHLVDHGFSALHSPLGRIYHAAKSRMNQHVESGDGGEGDLGSGGLSPARSGEEDGYGEEEDLFAAEEEQAIDDEWQEECEQAMEFNKYLVATQCVLGPAFCCFIMFNNQTYFKWVMLGSSIVGLVAAIPVLLYGKDGTAQPWRLMRCFAGFICSMVWIAAIADEVVDVLNTLGEILGLSDAIIGLTIFAVGNSLADLVANVIVAQFAPAMAYAACFGGP
ncbi:solute carrier family 24 (sodium/potassium/calcium exchanger), member 6 [Cryptococcus deuterogattii 2001/935-1]|nr:solute carrier family 24 (sodium/potassium/calcium exchanger), member 6 [Cryptococcus deuterogattii 2001/935-1]